MTYLSFMECSLARVLMRQSTSWCWSVPVQERTLRAGRPHTCGHHVAITSTNAYVSGNVFRGQGDVLLLTAVGKPTCMTATVV